MHENQPVAELIEKYQRGILSDAEKKAFFQLFERDDLAPEVEEYLWQNYLQHAETAAWPDEFRERFAERMVRRIIQSPQPARTVPFLQRHWWRYAAAVVLVSAATAAFFSSYFRNRPMVTPATSIQAQVSPGSTGAVLTLADGTQVVLDSLGNGVVAAQQGTNVVLNNGQLQYHTTDNHLQASYNTLEIPRGRQFQLVLPDGSKVWLNAASSIRYPTVFTGKDRIVEISGEAFFEVQKDNAKPFMVRLNNSIIEVLGTSFNVNAYEQENAVKTTLVEGALRVNANNSRQTIRPGQQAQVYADAPVRVMNTIDVSQVTAWKNGYFDFNDVDLPVMMRQLERWYDITVVYEGKVPDVTFKGKMDRNVQLSDVVSFLKNFGINANLQDRKLVISGS
jgi:ferric-dicitrate binding protein FerR (iron transport regulator)